MQVALKSTYYWGGNYLETAAFKIIYPQLQNIEDCYPIKAIEKMVTRIRLFA